MYKTGPITYLHVTITQSMYQTGPITYLHVTITQSMYKTPVHMIMTMLTVIGKIESGTSYYLKW